METGNILEASAGVQTTASCTAAEWTVRVELAIAYRLCDWLGITDLIHTHISVSVPGEQDAFLQLPYGHLFREARASSMVKCDVDGGILVDSTGLGISKGGFSIHAALHKAIPAAVCVMHAHSEASLAVANYQKGLLPLSQHALRFYGKVGYLDYFGLFETPEKRALLPKALGSGDVLMLRNHGPLVIGKSIREAFSRMYYLERACRMQVASLSQCRQAETELVYPPQAVCETMARMFEGGDAVIDREWNALVRMLQEIAPGFDQ